MTKNQRYSIIFFFLLITYLIVAYVIDTYVAKNMEFNGVVQNIEYDIKGSATITIKKIVYKPASNNWAFDHKILPGDSLIKLKNTMVIKLIKKKTKEVIFFW